MQMLQCFAGDTHEKLCMYDTADNDSRPTHHLHAADVRENEHWILIVQELHLPRHR